MCARSPGSQPHPGLHQEKCGQQVKGGDSAPLLCSGETSVVESFIQLWSPQHRKNMDLLEWVQRRDTKIIRGLEDLSCEERPRELGFFSLETVPGRPYCSLPVPEAVYKKAGEGLFTRACRDRTRGNGFKLKEGRFRLDVRNSLL